MDNSRLIDHLFRTEYGRLVSLITKFFGSEYIQLAEDVVQEALVAAIDSWGIDGVPANPQGWLLQVAKRKAINALKHDNMARQHRAHLAATSLFSDIDIAMADHEITDSQLRMIFTCCHASLDIKSQLALTLKTLCGFGVGEVSKALLTNEATINKRLYRAKKKIRASRRPFEIPQGDELEQRLETVALAMYLLFNEGYQASSGDQIIQKDLCLEAIRLSKLLVDHFPSEPSLSALLALMCLHVARFDARQDPAGAIILLEDQDRTLWDKELINIGMKYFSKSISAMEITPYHIEARIAAEYCLATSFELTNWQCIHDQYLLLDQLKPTPIVKLNLAILESKVKDNSTALKALEKLAHDARLSAYHLLPMAQGVLQMEEGEYTIAKRHLLQSLDMTKSSKERLFIKNKLVECDLRILNKA